MQPELFRLTVGHLEQWPPGLAEAGQYQANVSKTCTMGLLNNEHKLELVQPELFRLAVGHLQQWPSGLAEAGVFQDYFFEHKLMC
jgi:hypothetical protein